MLRSSFHMRCRVTKPRRLEMSLLILSLRPRRLTMSLRLRRPVIEPEVEEAGDEPEVGDEPEPVTKPRRLEMSLLILSLRPRRLTMSLRLRRPVIEPEAKIGKMERFYLEMVRKEEVPKPPFDDEGSEHPRKTSKKSNGDEGPSDPYITTTRIVMANPNPEDRNVPNEDVLEEDPYYLLDYDEEEDSEIDIEEEEPKKDPVEEPEPLAGHEDQFNAHPNPQPGNMNGWVDDDDDVKEEDDENEDVDIEEDDDAEIIFPYEVQGDQTPPPRDESFNSEFEAEEADDELKVEEAGD
nr:hypothetical protein [Tanacetum cinerariifolium]